MARVKMNKEPPPILQKPRNSTICVCLSTENSCLIFSSGASVAAQGQFEPSETTSRNEMRSTLDVSRSRTFGDEETLTTSAKYNNMPPDLDDHHDT